MLALARRVARVHGLHDRPEFEAEAVEVDTQTQCLWGIPSKTWRDNAHPHHPNLISSATFEEEARETMPKTNTTLETSHEDKDRSAEYTQPKISDYGDLVKVTATALFGPGLSCPW